MATGALAGCQRTPVSTGPKPSLPQDNSSETVALIPAARCGECHGKMELEWRSSAHARAEQSPLYRAMRKGAETEICDRCHAPLRAIVTSDPVVAEGVNCDVCHTVQSVHPASLPKSDGDKTDASKTRTDKFDSWSARFTMHLEDNIRYGPLCDARPHYFHSMGCSPLHEEASFCAACHDWSIRLGNGELLDVFPEYREWSAAPASAGLLTCQRCHMPSERAEVAVGSTERPAVSNHSFLGRGGLRKHSLSGHAQVSEEREQLRIRFSITNTGAGHYVPTGLPGRQVVVYAETVTTEGQVAMRAEQLYGRTLVDAAGREAPFYAAHRKSSDSRFRPGETVEVALALAVGPARLLRVGIAWRSLSHDLSARLGLQKPLDVPMLSATVALPLPGVPKQKRSSDALALELHP